MMFTLLVVLLMLVLLLPMVPALHEWRRPSDVQPLAIDEDDALDPPYLARSFAARLSEAVQQGATQLGTSELVRCRGMGGDALLTPRADERAAGVSHRLWYVEGDARLPEGMAFHAEIAAGGTVYTAPHSVCRALWAGNKIMLATRTCILRWAHAREVFVDVDCELAGRVTAERRVALTPGVRFTVLHAPRVLFLPALPGAHRPRASVAMPLAQAAQLQGVAWDALRQRAVAHGPLVVADDTAWQGDLVCAGDLTLGQRCVVDGSLKARGRLLLGPGCHIRGSVFAEHGVQLMPGCIVRGVVVSETRIELGSGCEVGALGALATVTAPEIQVACGVEVHGTVWAGRQGVCVAADAPPPASREAIAAPAALPPRARQAPVGRRPRSLRWALCREVQA